MELTVYDTTLNPLGVVDELNSLLWTRRYWSPGECKILAPFTDMNNKFLRQGNLIHKPGDDELAEIRYVQIKKNSTGMEEIEAQGRFLSGWLDKRILLAEINTTATAQALIKRVVTENLISPTVAERAFSSLVLDAGEGTIATTAVQFQGELYANCLDVCEALAKESAIGYLITTDLRSNHEQSGGIHVTLAQKNAWDAVAAYTDYVRKTVQQEMQAALVAGGSLDESTAQVRNAVILSNAATDFSAVPVGTLIFQYDSEGA